MKSNSCFDDACGDEAGKESTRKLEEKPHKVQDIDDVEE